MDPAAIAGLILGVGAIVGGQVLEGGRIQSILQPTAALIVLGGTLGATTLSFPLADLLRAIRLAMSIFFNPSVTPESLISEIVELANTMRKEGVLALEEHLSTITHPFLRAGIRYAVDGFEPAMTRELLETDLTVQDEAEEAGAKVFEAAGGYAPTVGILGAVLGLIHTMESLNDPSKLGEGIAVAFVATVYGVGSANLLFLPIANKIKRQLAQARICKEVIIQGVLAVQEGLNPRLLQEKLRMYLAEQRPAGQVQAPENEG
ncbi:MAG: flagellar motor protein [Nitrospinae bacterium]|nr:flagellar motor protein [Nitrospinota bacterium]